MYYPNSCQSRFSGVYLVFEVVQEREFKDMLAVFYLVFAGVYHVFEAFQTKAVHFCLPCSHKEAVAHLFSSGRS